MKPDEVHLRVTYSQEKDSMSLDDDVQFLDIFTQDAGDGSYFVIETSRWAFDNVSELIAMLSDFQYRVRSASNDLQE